MEILFSWGALSALILFLSVLQYIWGIYQRSVPRPLLSTWAMWAILGYLLLRAYEGTGAEIDTTLLAAWVGLINPLLVVATVLVCRYGELTWTRFDTKCALIFIATVIGWRTLDNPLIGLLGGIVADLVSAIPQIRKNWQEPHDEIWYPWTVFCIGSGINLLAVAHWELSFEGIGYWLYPIYFFVGSGSIAIPVVLHRLGHYKNKPAKQQKVQKDPA